MCRLFPTFRSFSKLSRWSEEDRVHGADVWRRIVGLDKATVIEDVKVDDAENIVVVHVRPRRASKRRCGRCGVRAPGYDHGEGRWRWRCLDLGTVQCFLES